jgi:hypothetical protein
VDWVKLSARYYMDVAVASLPDADAEVMFTRSLAYAGSEETGGFVPAGVLPALCRRRRYEMAAEALVAAGLWRPVRGGYKITRWSEWQSELEALVRRRSADRDRKRRERERASAASGTSSTSGEHGSSAQVSDLSRDRSTDSHAPIESKREKQQKTSSSVSRAQRIPAGFTVTPDMVTWARQNTPHVDGRLETEKFIDYWQAKAGKDACKADWVATWRNWMRRAAEQQPAPRGRHHTPQGRSGLFADARARENGYVPVPIGELE